MIKSFTLGGKKYKVVTVNHDSHNLGVAHIPLNEVQLQNTWGGREIPEESQEQTLMHEVVHCILTDIGRDDLSCKEDFVQSFAVLLHQFIKTMK